MATLTTADAILLVRKNLDEVGLNDSVMYGTSQDETSDNNSIDDIIKKNVPEAINEVHKAAPVHLLEGEAVNRSNITGFNLAASTKIMSFTLPETGFLRLVAFKATDSDIVVTDAIPEASAEGRKQLNQYIRGTYDRPRLILLQETSSTKRKFKYYTCKSDTAAAEANEGISYMFIIKEQKYAAATSNYTYSELLRQNIIDWLTAKVMETYGDQRAQAYYQRALTFHQ